MRIHNKNVVSLLESVKMDKFYVVCHFKCDVKNKTVISTVPFEPYEGKIEFTYKEIFLHPIKSYNKYYHTPITIYGGNTHETIIVKAFERVSNYFTWNKELEKYIYTH